MSVRRSANDTGSIEVRKVKSQICSGTGLSDSNLSIDQLVRMAAKQGFSVVVSCVRVKS